MLETSMDGKIIKEPNNEAIEASLIIRRAFDEMGIRLYKTIAPNEHPLAYYTLDGTRRVATDIYHLCSQIKRTIADWYSTLADEILLAKFDSPRLASILKDFNIALTVPADMGRLGGLLRDNGDVLLKAFYKCNEKYFTFCELISDCEGINHRIDLSIIVNGTEKAEK